MSYHGLDNEKRVFFYEHEFYVLSNFSSFKVLWRGRDWMTAEHAYHSERFTDAKLQEKIFRARSAHDAKKIAYQYKKEQRSNWEEIKLSVMKEVLREKVAQHSYVKKKLLETGDRELVENSWRDSYWGWGPNKDGENQLGKLWMEIRDELMNNAFPTY